MAGYLRRSPKLRLAAHLAGWWRYRMFPTLRIRCRLLLLLFRQRVLPRDDKLSYLLTLNRGSGSGWLEKRRVREQIGAGFVLCPISGTFLLCRASQRAGALVVALVVAGLTVQVRLDPAGIPHARRDHGDQRHGGDQPVKGDPPPPSPDHGSPAAGCDDDNGGGDGAGGGDPGDGGVSWVCPESHARSTAGPPRRARQAVIPMTSGLPVICSLNPHAPPARHTMSRSTAIQAVSLSVPTHWPA